MARATAFLAAPELLSDPRERSLAGRVGGILYLAACLIGTTLVTATDAVERLHGVFLALSLLGGVWGLACVWLVPWERWPGWPLVVGTFTGLALALLGTVITGGESSPVRLQALFVLVYAAYFFPLRLATVAALATAAATCLPLVLFVAPGEGRPLQAGLDALILLSVGQVIVAASAAMRTARAAAEGAAQREEALGAVATAVASEEPLERTFEMAAVRLGALLGADGATVMRYDPDDRVTVVGVWTAPNAPFVPVGTSLHARAGGEHARLRASRAPVRVDAYDDGATSHVARLGYGSFVAVPVIVAGEVWGTLSASTLAARGLPDDAEARVGDVALVVALAVGADAARAQLTVQALTDPLTGLANRRAFHDRLGEEVGRALRHDRPLTLVVLDLDRFKATNDLHGHAAGDRALTALASALRAAFRSDDVIGRLGGDEFAVLLPETPALEALVGTDRVRAELRLRGTDEPYDVSFSAGVCDLTQAAGVDELERHADMALYQAKHRGAGLSWIYDHEVAGEIADAARERGGRAETLGGLHALARAIDAKDHSTREHSRRVAEIAGALATGLGWGGDRIRLLREAAVLHDVGKIGVPDRILLKPARLDAAEYAVVQKHAALGAQIVDGVLTPEQVRWVRGHHERVDGRGYPDGLAGTEIPDGAAVLAVADAFDAMTSSRPYGVPLSVDVALRECRAGAGTQFDAAVVAVLEALPLAGPTSPVR